MIAQLTFLGYRNSKVHTKNWFINGTLLGKDDFVSSPQIASATSVIASTDSFPVGNTFGNEQSAPQWAPADPFPPSGFH